MIGTKLIWGLILMFLVLNVEGQNENCIECLSKDHLFGVKGNTYYCSANVEDLPPELDEILVGKMYTEICTTRNYSKEKTATDVGKLAGKDDADPPAPECHSWWWWIQVVLVWSGVTLIAIIGLAFYLASRKKQVSIRINA